MLLTMLLQVSRSQVNRAIMMTKEKDLEILCDLVVSGIVSKSPSLLRGSEPAENQDLDTMHINRFPFGWPRSRCHLQGGVVLHQAPEPLLQRGCGPAIQAKNGLGCS